MDVHTRVGVVLEALGSARANRQPHRAAPGNFDLL